MNFKLKIGLFSLAFIVFFWQLSIAYFNHFQDSSVEAYAYIYQIMKNHPFDKELITTVSSAISDNILSSSEVKGIVFAYGKPNDNLLPVPLLRITQTKEYYLKAINSEFLGNP